MKKYSASCLIIIVVLLLQGCASHRVSNIAQNYSIKVESSTNNIIQEEQRTSISVEDLIKRVNQRLESKLLETGFTKDRPELVLNYNIDYFGYGHFLALPFDRFIAKYTITVTDPKTSKVVFTVSNSDAETDALGLIDEMSKNIFYNGMKGIYNKL